MNCQQCKQPLQIDASLVDLAPSAYEMVAGSVPRYGASHASGKYTSAHDKLSRTPGHPSVKAVWERSTYERSGSRGLSNQQHRATIAGGESFVLLQDSIIKKIPTTPPSPNFPRGVVSAIGNNVAAGSSKSSSTGKNKTPRSTNGTVPSSSSSPPNVPMTPLSHHLRSTLRLYSILSSKTEVDHPLCDECTHLLIKLLNRQLDDTKKERDLYIGAEKELRKEREKEMTEPSKVGSSEAENERQIEALKEDEKRAIEELRDAQRESERLEAELRALELEEKELEEEEAEWVLLLCIPVCY
jgi:beclin